MEYNYRNLSDVIKGDVFLAQDDYEDKDALRDFLTPFDGCDFFSPEVSGINNEDDFDWPTHMSESINALRVEEDDLLEFGNSWNLQSNVDEEEIDKNENSSGKNKEMMVLRMDETEWNPSQMVTNYAYPNSGFETLYDYDPNSRFEGVDDMSSDNGYIMDEYIKEKSGACLEEVLSTASYLEDPEVHSEHSSSDYTTDSSRTFSNTRFSSFDDSSNSSTVPSSSTNLSNPVSTASVTPFDHYYSSSPFYSPFSPSTINMHTELSSYEPITSDDPYSADLGYSVLADSSPHSPSSSSFDTSNPIPCDDHSVLNSPSTDDSLNQSSSAISPFSKSFSAVPSTRSTFACTVNSRVSMHFESRKPLSPSIRLGKLVKSVNAVSGIKDNVSKRKTKKSKEVAPIVTPLRKLSIDSRLEELFDLTMQLSDCKTESERLQYFALLLNARKPSRKNMDAKLAMKKVLREELRPSQAVFVYGLKIKPFMRQYNRLLAKAEVERRKMDMPVMTVCDGDARMNGPLEENKKRNVVPTQVYAVEEEVIDPIDDCEELDYIFSVVFGDLFDGWDMRRGIRETVMTLKTAISEGNRPSRKHLPESDVSDDVDIEKDVIPFYRKMVEEFKKTPELSLFVNMKRVMITGPMMTKE